MEHETKIERETEEKILETIKIYQEWHNIPLAWAMEVGKCIVSLVIRLSSPELGQILDDSLYFHNNHHSLWKFLHQAFSFHLLSPFHVLSLLPFRVIPCRRSQPEAYMLYLKLLSRYVFQFDPLCEEVCKDKLCHYSDLKLNFASFPLMNGCCKFEVVQC